MPEVVYELSLKDGLTGKLTGANHAATNLEGTLGKVGNRLIHIAEGFGVSFGMWKGFEFLEKSVSTYESLEESQSQVEAGLKSTAHAAGVSSEDLSKYANELSKHVKENVNEIQDLQSQVLTFPAVTKANFEKTTESILDMATRMHRDKDQIAIAIGKALQDPEHNIANLHRYGLNFNDAQTAAIKQLVASGHTAEAQMKILNELAVEFGGSARAAFDADPMAQFNKATYNLEIGLGQVATTLLREVTPYLVEFTNKALDLVHWLKENGSELWEIIKALGSLYISLRVGSTITASYAALMEGLATAEAGAATATEGLAASSTAALGPLGLIAAEIYGLVQLYDDLSDSEDRASARMKEFSQQGYDAEKKELDKWKKYYKGHGYNETDSQYNAYNNEKAKLTGDIADLQGQLAKVQASEKSHLLGDIGGQAKKLEYQIGVRQSQMKAVDDYMNAPTDLAKGRKPGGATGPTIKPETKGAKGNKAVTINIKIDALQKGDIKLMVTNLKEGAGKVQEMVTQALMNAVNNSQIIAEH